MIGQGLTLVTGATGSGKSAHVVDMLRQITDRPLFVMGIPDLKVEHQQCPPVSDWVQYRQDEADPTLSLAYFAFPPNAIIVLDEAQRVFRPRPVGSKVPPEVQAFETRRHTGVDFVLITQHPSFIDANVRKLVTRHIHIHCTFLGRYRLEWVGLGDPNDKASRELASRTKYKLPAKAFELYKSSELHTKVVVKRPWYYYALPLVVLATIGLGWYLYGSFKGRMDGATVLDAAAKGGGEFVKAANDKHKPSGAREYVAEYKPRVEGLIHTAPVYDGVTQVMEAPIISGCVEGAKSACKCYDQRGNTYRTTVEICRQFINGGIFFAFRPPESSSANVTRSDAPAAGASPSAAARPGSGTEKPAV